jgi:mannose-6-phosphate isomerase-like protein (cupin superfamily)
MVMTQSTVEICVSEVWSRPWGEEVLLVHTNDYTGKLLKYQKGYHGNLQLHRVKDEAGHVLSGMLHMEWDDGTGKLTGRILGPGDTYRVPPGVAHKATALEDAVVVEFSNAVFNDRVRCENQYGQEEDSGGLPSTTIDEIEVGFPRRKYLPST